MLINQLVGILALCGFIGIPLVLYQQKIIDKLNKENTTLKLANKLLEKTQKILILFFLCGSALPACCNENNVTYLKCTWSPVVSNSQYQLNPIIYTDYLKIHNNHLYNNNNKEIPATFYPEKIISETTWLESDMKVKQEIKIDRKLGTFTKKIYVFDAKMRKLYNTSSAHGKCEIDNGTNFNSTMF